MPIRTGNWFRIFTGSAISFRRLAEVTHVNVVTPATRKGIRAFAYALRHLIDVLNDAAHSVRIKFGVVSGKLGTATVPVAAASLTYDRPVALVPAVQHVELCLYEVFFVPRS